MATLRGNPLRAWGPRVSGRNLSCRVGSTTSPTPHVIPHARPADPAAVHRAGTLVYTAAGLRTVFAWLLAGEVVFTLIDMLEP